MIKWRKAGEKLPKLAKVKNERALKHSKRVLVWVRDTNRSYSAYGYYNYKQQRWYVEGYQSSTHIVTHFTYINAPKDGLRT